MRCQFEVQFERCRHIAKPDDRWPGGAFRAAEANDAAWAEALDYVDPFWPTGLRRSVRTLAWTRVFADGARLIER